MISHEHGTPCWGADEPSACPFSCKQEKQQCHNQGSRWGEEGSRLHTQTTAQCMSWFGRDAVGAGWQDEVQDGRMRYPAAMSFTSQASVRWRRCILCSEDRIQKVQLDVISFVFTRNGSGPSGAPLRPHAPSCMQGPHWYCPDGMPNTSEMSSKQYNIAN